MTYLIAYAVIAPLFFVMALALFCIIDEFSPEVSEASGWSKILSAVIVGVLWPIFIVITLAPLFKRKK